MDLKDEDSVSITALASGAPMLLEHVKLSEPMKNLPGLREKKGGPFPQQDESSAKNNRLQAVILELSSAHRPRHARSRYAATHFATSAAHTSVMSPHSSCKINKPMGIMHRMQTSRSALEPFQLSSDLGVMQSQSFSRRLDADRLRDGNNQGGATRSVLGSLLLANFQAIKPKQLVGQVARTPHDITALAQVYRDRRFETFRMIHEG